MLAALWRFYCTGGSSNCKGPLARLVSFSPLPHRVELEDLPCNNDTARPKRIKRLIYLPDHLNGERDRFATADAQAGDASSTAAPP